MVDNRVNHPNLYFYPTWLTDLQQEVVRYYPHLIPKYDLNGKDFSEVIGALGVEVNVAIDGTFDEKQLEGLCRLILERLQDRRKIVVPTQMSLPNIL